MPCGCFEFSLLRVLSLGKMVSKGPSMGVLMIRCAKTGRAIATGIMADRATFHATPVFFSHIWCPLCCVTHEWFAKDAWVCESASVCDARSDHCDCERQVA